MTQQKKNHHTINTIKLNFVRKPVVYTILPNDTSYIKSYSQSNIKDIERHRNPTSLNRQKNSRRTKQISKERVMSQELKVLAKLQVTSFYIKIMSCKLQFSKKFAESNFETASC